MPPPLAYKHVSLEVNQRFKKPTQTKRDSKPCPPQKKLVISAVNITEAGTLEVLRQSIEAAAKLEGWDTVALVHSKKMFEIEGITYIELPEIKGSWIRRIFFEYFKCKELAKRLNPDFWLSMHDLTPNLGALSVKVPQAVYCHNAMCFYSMKLGEILLEPKLIMFSLFYSFAYRINLVKNYAVIVQQDWLRNEFRSRLKYTGKIIVAYPNHTATVSKPKKSSGRHFFFPSYPRVFKNFELLLQAWETLTKDSDWDGELTVTLDANSNRYSKWLLTRFGSLRGVNFIGTVSRSVVEEYYKQSDCLVFPSRLETWGLPITEAKRHGLFILAADLPYAHETVGEYEYAAFFDPNDPFDLARNMSLFRWGHLSKKSMNLRLPDSPFVPDWQSFYDELLSSY